MLFNRNLNLGNMWGQEWNILDLVQPFPEADNVDVTSKLKDDGWTVDKMFRFDINALHAFVHTTLPVL